LGEERYNRGVNLLKMLAATRRAVPRILPLFRDARVPLWLKLATAVTAVFIISPLDIFSDIPIIGILDDAALLALLANLFVMFADRSLMRNVTPTTARHAEARVVSPTALKP
jgi:uncharacterized membrane protein YkvA (DUF1232 family)